MHAACRVESFDVDFFPTFLPALTASPPSHFPYSPVPLISFSDNVTPTYTQEPRLSQQLVCTYLEQPSCLGIALINVPLSSLLFFFHLRRSCKVKTATMVNGK
jgi:hypothetical protein